LSTYFPPEFSTSYRHLATVVTTFPAITPAAARISTPWQTLATGLWAATNVFVIRTRSASYRRYSGARPPVMTMPAYDTGFTSRNAAVALSVYPGYSTVMSQSGCRSCSTRW
jgi:hypothetical protein